MENSRTWDAIVSYLQKQAKLSIDEFVAFYVDKMVIRNYESHLELVEWLGLPSGADILQIQERLNTMPQQNTLLFDFPNSSVAKQG